jgi:hypothetical protein
LKNAFLEHPRKILTKWATGSKKRKGPGFRLSVFQRSQAGFGVVDFGLAGVGVFPQVEEFAVVLGRPPLIALLLKRGPKDTERLISYGNRTDLSSRERES